LALFKGSGVSKEDALRRVMRRDWTDRAGMLRAFQDLATARGVGVEDLIPLLAGKDPTVRNFGIHLLKERLDQRGFRNLFRALSTRTTQTRVAVLRAALASRSDLVLPALEKLAFEGSPSESNIALDVLGSFDAKVVATAFTGFLAGPFDLQFAALGRIAPNASLRSDPGIQSAVSALARDDDERVRLKVLEILEAADPAEAVKVGLEALDDPSLAVQQKGLEVVRRATTELKSEAAEDKLIGLLAEGSEQIRSAVLDLIVESSDKTRLLRKLLVFSGSLMGWMRDRLLAALRDYADALTDPVIELMSDPDQDVRTQALLVGASLEATGAVPHILSLLGDDDWWLRLTAIETLGKIGDPRAVEPLLSAMREPDNEMACAEALGRIGDERALGPLAHLLSSPAPEVRVEALRSLRRMADRRVLPVLYGCAEHDPEAAIRERAEELIDALEEGREMPATTGMFRIPDALRTGLLETLEPLEQLLVQAREMDASDLHVVVGSPPMVKVHGQFQELDGDALGPDDAWALIEPLLGPQQRKTLLDERAVDFCHVIQRVGRYRANVYVESKGPAAAFRVISRRIPTLSDIGLPGHLADLVNYGQGLVVIAGPSGSGKSTTLAGLVNLFNETKRRHILLLEDPIEFVHPPKGCLINQRAVGKHAHSFAAALRGALRQDPDVIVVGEMRDPETVRLAIEASETGHLVIGTMHTTSAPKTVDRIVESFPVAEQDQIRVMLSETLKMVICQTLLPRADGEGRVACFEVMMADLGISSMIRDAKTYQILGQMQIGETQGQQTWDTALERLVEARLISPDVAYARARRADRFKHLLGTGPVDETIHPDRMPDG